jgi:hypothetical protein
MSNTKYDAIWVPGSFFEKGHWKLTPKTGDSGFGALIVLILVIFVACIIILISPLIISLIGFSLIKGKRYYASIFSFIALLYLFIDYQKQWITSFIIFGTKQENFTNGILGIKYALHFYIINSVAFGISIYFIVSSCFINLKKSNDDLNSIENDKNLISIVLGIVFGTLCFFLLNNPCSKVEIKASEVPVCVDSTYISPNTDAVPETYQTSYTDTTNISSDTIQSANIDIQKYQIGQELDGGIVFQLNDEQTHGLIFYDTGNLLGIVEAKNWILEKNIRFASIDELSTIVNNYEVFKDKCCYWSSEFAYDIEEKQKYKILCRTVKSNDREVSIEDYDFIKCYNLYDKTIILIQSDCNSYQCQTIGVASF